MDPSTLLLVAGGCLAVAAIALGGLLLRMGAISRAQAELRAELARVLEESHRGMLKDLAEGLAALADRLGTRQDEGAERLRTHVAQELRQSREALLALQLTQGEELSANRETMAQKIGALGAEMQLRQDQLKGELLARMLERIAEQARADQELIRTALAAASAQLAAAVETLTRTVDTRLGEIGGKVTERLETGFQRTNETFASVMARLATIDEAQRKIEGLATDVVSLQELLGDKRARGAFGEVQLEALVRNMLPPGSYAFQHTLGNQTRVDCILRLPEPTGNVPVDSKFPLENYHRMFARDLSEADRTLAQKQFRGDVRKHVDDIATRYIVPGETAGGAILFVPAEAVFAEIHAYHPDVVEHAMQRRVWIVSPTTLMAVLNTARAVIKDVETRRQVHVIQAELSKLGKDFGRFDERMRRLADHIRQAHDDAQQVRISGDRISQRFSRIERVELDQPASIEALELPGDAVAPEPGLAPPGA